jgi:class I fructose-bisphosphate aldolase
LYAVTYAARVAHELGADVVKVNFPEGVNQYCPEPYKSMKLSFKGQIEKVIRAAGHSLVIFAGGSKDDDNLLLGKLHDAMDAGGAGVIFGRNMWQRPFDQGLAFAGRVQEILSKYPS